MATPIKDTPILTGKDADRFERMAQANMNRPVTQEDRIEWEKSKKAYDYFYSRLIPSDR